MKPTTDQVIPIAQAFLDANDGAGVLHLVLEDQNIDNSDVEFCRDAAAAEKNQDAVNLADLLLQMSKTQRRKVVNSLRWTPPDSGGAPKAGSDNKPKPPAPCAATGALHA